MSKVVLDASAILAILGAEPGSEKLTTDVLTDAVASTVNLAEVQAKLVDKGWPRDEAWEDATSMIHQVLDFSDEHAKLAGSLVIQTRHLGLSLGDRACLALGLFLKVPVYTAERAWRKLKLNIPIHVIR